MTPRLSGPQTAKKKKKKKTWQARAIGAGLEEFVGTNPRVSESTEVNKAEMSNLVSSFSRRMGKRAASAQGYISPSFEVAGGKHPKLFDPNEEAQKNQTVINVDSLDRAFDAKLAWEGAPPRGLQRGLCTTGGWDPNQGISQC